MTITLTREEAQQVLDALEEGLTSKEYRALVETLRARISAPEPEPVAWLSVDSIGERYLCFSRPKDNDSVQPLYTAPPQRELVQFPTMLRKMWSGAEVQAWLDENVNQENNNE